ncbi:MAG TPA: hypothetical protein VKD19_07085 [Pseudolabrys sp.]|nr:hypothetical protein [Pseudolabrys sp.]
MAAAHTMVVPGRTMVIGIASGTTILTTDIIAETVAIIRQVAIGP